MRTKITLLLALLNVVLFYAIFYLRNAPSNDQESGLVLGSEANDPRSIQISTANGGVIKLERMTEGWVLTQPTAWTANDFAVRYILNELQSLRAETSFPVEDLVKTGQTLADYGLENPPVTLTLQPSGDGTQPVILRIGDATKGSNRLYVLSPDGRRVHVVNRTLAERLSLSLNELRSDTLFHIPVFEAQALTLEAAPGQRTLFRRDGERWMIETLQTQASGVDTELAIGALTALRLQSFVPTEQAESIQTSITNSSMRITLEGNHRRETLLLGSAVPSSAAATAPEGTTLHYARVEDDPARSRTPFILPVQNELLATLRNAQRELREKKILNFDPSSVSAILIKGEGAEFTLQRIESAATSESSATAWQLVSRRGEQGLPAIPADTAMVQGLLQSLSRLSAEEFTNDAPSQADRENYGFTRPVREVTLSFAAKNAALPPQPLTLVVGVGSNHLTYASMTHREPIYRIDDAFLRDVPASRLHFRERVVRSLPDGAQITFLSLQDLGSSRQIVNTALPVPEGMPQRDAIMTIASELRNLRAARFVQDNFPTTVQVDGAERPWRYRLDATLNLVGGAQQQTETYTLFLAERTGGTTWMAGSPAADVVFTLSPPLLDAFFSLTYEPREADVRPAPAQAPSPVPTPTPTPEAAPAP